MSVRALKKVSCKKLSGVKSSRCTKSQSVFLIKELNARAARKVTGLEQNIKVEWVYLRVRKIFFAYTNAFAFEMVLK